MKDTTSDSQVNSCFPYRWPPASLTFNIYFYLFLYQYITRITINNGTPHLKPPKSQNRRAALGQPAINLHGGGGGGGGGFNLFAVDQPSPMILPWLIRQNNYNKSITPQNKNKPLNQIKTLDIYFYLFSDFFIIKQDREQSGQLCRWPQC